MAIPNIVHVVGARPNFMKAAPVIRALQAFPVSQRLIHTGQHYDPELSDVFFEQLRLPAPDANLAVGSGSHAAQTAALMLAIEHEFLRFDPTAVAAYGDVNSTMAAALVAAKLGIAVAHVESGLRSFDTQMPEEINRRVTDLLADWLFVTAPEGLENLRAEGVPDSRLWYVGNPMIDSLVTVLPGIDDEVGGRPFAAEPYAVATVHRPSNVDDPDAARSVALMLQATAALLQVVIPLHPRGRSTLMAAGLRPSARLRIVTPLGYREFIALVRRAAVVVTDSGGLQEETTFLGTPCLTIRTTTERPCTITHGTNQLVSPEEVPAAVARILAGGRPATRALPPLWDGQAGTRIASILADLVGGHRGL